MDCSLLGSSLHGIFQARILEWIVTSSSRGCPNPRIEPASPALAGGFLKHGATSVSFHRFVWDGPLEAVLCFPPEAFDSPLENHHPSLPWDIGKKWLGPYLFFFPLIIFWYLSISSFSVNVGVSHTYIYSFLSLFLHILWGTDFWVWSEVDVPQSQEAQILGLPTCAGFLQNPMPTFNFSIFKKEGPTRCVNFWFTSSESTPEYGSPEGLWHLSITELISKWFAS